MRRREEWGIDDLVDEAAFGRLEGIGEFFLIFGRARGDLFGIIELRNGRGSRFAPLAPITAISAGRPGIVDVGTDMFRGHHVIGAAIAFRVISVTIGTVAWE